MQTLSRILIAMMFIAVCFLVVQSTLAGDQMKPQPVPKGVDKITDLGAGMPYQGPSEAELAKLAQVTQQQRDEIISNPFNLPTASKPAEVVTDLSSGVPYQGMSAAEKQKLQDWQMLFTPAQNSTANPKIEAMTDKGAGQPYPGLNEAEKAKLGTGANNQK